MAEVDILPGQKHDAVWETGVGAVAFLHNHYLFLHVAVHEVNLELGAIFRLSPASFDRALYQPGIFGLRHPLYPGVFWRWFVLPLGYPTNPIMGMVVHHR